MASETTGNKSLDCIRTNQLCLDTIEFSSKKLNKEGVVVSKFFMGEESEEVKKLGKNILKKLISLNPAQVEANQEKLIYIVAD